MKSNRNNKNNNKKNDNFKDRGKGRYHRKSKSNVRIKSYSVDAQITSINKSGKAVFEYKGSVFEVPYLLPGEKALLELKEGPRYTEVRTKKLKKESQDRVKPACRHFKECGGCHLQHMNYEAQLKFKQDQVKNLMSSYGKVNEIIGMENPYDYRNKVHSTFKTEKKGSIISGIYKPYSHDIVPIDRCVIQNPKADELIMSIRKIAKKCKLKPYNEDLEKGFLRHVLIRTGYNTGEIMVVLVVTKKIFPSKTKFIAELKKAHPEVDTLIMNLNSRKTSVVLGGWEKVLYGKGYIEDILCGKKFQLSARSFYQINPIQTEKLYNKAIEMAELKGNEVVLDTYCGIGTIGIIASDKAKKVIGVEVNHQAVKNAKNNAKINECSNIEFYERDATDFMKAAAKDDFDIDVLFMDPPREGSNEHFLGAAVKLSPRTIVYISCNPETQARDLKYLVKDYEVREIQPVDLFPQTHHSECIVKLVRKGL
ncbi:MAG: 23S rRNA (uracil(1939)-C(5))-methyltransferase RlmD [Tissierellales bacterium]|jgi:23S rRNA (uracil1939-C5)-methyltransferase|nr:23S rRNA (uracil(1939)-C(5))-methyltransferase RlmD [Tissierellales bacterium]